MKAAKDQVLVVDTDPRFGRILSSAGHEATSVTVDSYEEIAQKLRPRLAVVGSKLAPDTIRDVVQVLSSQNCATLLVVDAYTPSALAQIIDAGADAFVQGGVSEEEFMRVVQREMQARSVTPEVVAPDPPGPPEMVGASGAMNDLCGWLARTAPSSLPVLVTGESGTGKELVAQSIHRLSPRRAKPFVTVNCGTVSRDLFESELFGHERGAFAGATETKMGKFEMANGGTLFIDEVSELPPTTQAKLLRVLEEKQFTRVGSEEPTPCDVRLVCATNRDLPAEVAAGRFRQDLLYRLDVLRIETPPLRRRASDIQILWEHFVNKAAREEGRAALETRPDVVRMLMQYDWPGNVRELEYVARQAVIRRSSGRITPRAWSAIDSARIVGRKWTPMRPLRSLEEIERDAILFTYQAVDSIKEASEILQVSERKLYYRLKQYREQGWLDAEDESEEKFKLLFAHADRHTWIAAEPILQERFNTLWVPDGMHLLNAVHEAMPDAMVVQAALPVLDGINVLELGFEHGWNFPVVLVGDSPDDSTRDYAEALGASAFLEGGVDADRLKWVLETALTLTVR